MFVGSAFLVLVLHGVLIEAPLVPTVTHLVMRVIVPEDERL